MRIPRSVSALAASAVILAGLASCHSRPIRERDAWLPLASGDSLFYRIVGTGPDTIIFAHGGPAVSSRYLERAFRSLADHHTLVFYDQRGRGRSSPARQPDSLSFAQDVEDLAALQRHLGVRAAHLVGHDWGAGVALVYARLHPEAVRRMVLLSPPVSRIQYTMSVVRMMQVAPGEDDGHAVALEAGRDSTDPSGFCRDFWQWHFSPWKVLDAAEARRLAPEMCAPGEGSMRERDAIRLALNRSLGPWNWEGALDSLAVPRLVIVGDRDSVFVIAAEPWARQGESRLLVLPGSSVFPWLPDPESLHDVLSRFLTREQWPAGARKGIASSS